MQRKIYQNKRNNDKYLEVVRYRCGHYYVVQFMKWGSLVNKLGSRTGRRGRWSKEYLDILLKDYTEVEPFGIKLLHKGRIWQHVLDE